MMIAKGLMAVLLVSAALSSAQAEDGVPHRSLFNEPLPPRKVELSELGPEYAEATTHFAEAYAATRLCPVEIYDPALKRMYEDAGLVGNNQLVLSASDKQFVQAAKDYVLDVNSREPSAPCLAVDRDYGASGTKVPGLLRAKK